MTIAGSNGTFSLGRPGIDAAGASAPAASTLTPHVGLTGGHSK